MILRLFSLCICLLFAPLSGRADCAASVKIAGTQTPILIYDISMDDMRDPPLLQIWANGRVSVLSEVLGAPPVEGWLNSAELSDLLSQFDPRKLPQTSADIPFLADAPTSYIEVNLPDCQYQIAQYGLALLPGLQDPPHELQSISESERKLFNLADMMRNRETSNP